MPCCKSDLYGGWCTDYPVVDYKDDNRELCVFHAPQGKKGVTLEEFNQVIFKRLNEALDRDEVCNLSCSIFEGPIDFGGKKLPAVNFSSATFAEASFNGASFNGNANFSLASFKKDVGFCTALFGGLANFNGAIFDGKVDFRMIDFNRMDFREATLKKADFNLTKFHEKADFCLTKFGKVNFGLAKFFDEADFVGASFDREAVFIDTGFTGDAKFNAASFHRESRYDRAIFKGKAEFTETNFVRRTSFSRAYFLELASFEKATFNDEGVFYGKTFGGSAVFKNVVIRDRLRFQNVNIKHIEFLETDLRQIDFVNCDPLEEKGRYLLEDEKVVFSVQKPDKREIRKVESLYRAQKQKCKRDHNEFAYSHWHISEKEMMRRRTDLRDNFFYWSLLNLYRLLSGYGEDPKRALFCLPIIFLIALIGLGVSGLNYSNGSKLHLLTPPPQNEDFSSLKRAALTTFEYLTFQKETYFGLKPANGRTAFLRIVFTILFYIQTALLIMAVRNRFRR